MTNWSRPLTEPSRRRHRLPAVIACLMFAPCLATAVTAAPKATIKAATVTLSQGQTARFDISSSATESSDLQAFCSLKGSGGHVTIAVEGENYIPLSEPAVGDMLTLAPHEKRDYRLTGTVEANPGTAHLSFRFAGSPAAFCFPGMDCSGAAAGGKSVTVSCRPN